MWDLNPHYWGGILRRVLTVLALFATLIWVLSMISNSAKAQPAAAPGTATAIAPVVIASGPQYAGVRGLAADAAGSLYISLETTPAPAQCVTRPALHSPGNASGAGKIGVTIFSNCTAVPGEDPSGIAVTPLGHVFLANRGQNLIRFLDMSTGRVTIVPASAAKNAALSSTSNLDLFEPAGLAIDAARNLYVADRGHYRVLALHSGAGKFTYLAHVLDAAAVAVDSARGQLYVASPASNRIFVIGLATGGVNVFAGSGAFPSGNSANFPSPVSAPKAAIAAPEGIAVDGAGNLFIADTGANAILRVSAKSGMLTHAAPAANLNSPGALAIDRKGNLFVADRGNHRVVEFAGLAAPASTASVTISPAQFDFGAEPTGGTTPAQVFTFTNSSANALSLSTTDLSFTGTNPNDFTQTNNCVPQVPAGGSCQINVVFVPQASGARSAALQVVDADPSSPQTAQVSGTGDDFEVTAASSSSTSVNVVPGNSGVFNLQITPDNTFSGVVTLACPVQLANDTLTCSASPATVNVTAGQPAPFTVTITTGGPNATATARMLPGVPPNFPRDGRPIAFLAILAAMMAALLLVIFRRARSRRIAGLVFDSPSARARARFAFVFCAVIAALAVAGCSGGSSAVNPNETPVGIYTIDFSATAQNASRAITLTLNVD